jgi:hypothetical protein
MVSSAQRRLAAGTAILLAMPALSGASADERADVLAAAAWATPVLGASCDFSRFGQGDLGGSAVFDIPYRTRGQGQDEPDNVFTLIQLFCAQGAYNTRFVYLSRQDGDFALLAFAQPVYDYDYSDENFTTLKAPPIVTGFSATTELVNSSFDPNTGILSMHAQWRGLGDAWSAGEWEFREATFVLKTYSVDPTYDLNADNPDQSSAEESWQLYPAIRRNRP